MNIKKQMIRATGIVAMVVGTLVALWGLSWAASSWAMTRNDTELIGYIVLGVLILIIGAAKVVFGEMLFSRSLKSEINVKTCNIFLSIIVALSAVTIICLSVCAVLKMYEILLFNLGGVAMLTISLIALLIGDGSVTQRQAQPLVSDNKNPMVTELEESLARLKQYRDDGVITEKQYKQKVREAAQKRLLD